MVDSVKDRLIYSIEQKVQAFVSKRGGNRRQSNGDEVIERKQRLFRGRDAEIVKCTANGQILRKQRVKDETQVNYIVHYQFLIKQKSWMYVEEQIEERCALFWGDKLVKDIEVVRDRQIAEPYEKIEREQTNSEKGSYQYDRFSAVKYAEVWWNSYNPAFKKFDVNCTNFVSQCLLAGGIPMSGYPNRTRGWWMKNNSWSYSWTVAHALRWYLSSAHSQIKAVEVSSPEQLMPGDVICYDFQGDGRFDHTTIVVAKDQQGMPLVNAHSTNSRMRYWSYEDSTAYTSKIKYKFFHLL